VNVLSANDLVVESPESNRRPVQINRQRLSIPDDPILRIPNQSITNPSKPRFPELRENINDVVGIILYGSVARGEADRRSDIDLWVLTRSGRTASQRKRTPLPVISKTRRSMVTDTPTISMSRLSRRSRRTPKTSEIVVSGIPILKTSDFEIVENLLLEEGTADE